MTIVQLKGSRKVMAPEEGRVSFDQIGRVGEEKNVGKSRPGYGNLEKDDGG